MPESNQTPRASAPTRRQFIANSTAAMAAAAVASAAIQSAVYAGSTDTIKVGLVGCGGRGTGAAANALRADPNIKLVALGDMFKDQFDIALSSLAQTEVAPQVAVDDDHKFVGWDAYKGVIESSDVVLLATPPHFRPLHVNAVIAAGKHCFCEKPVGVDALSVQSVMETTKLAKEKNLNLVSGLCYRYDAPKQECVKRIHDGAVGKILTLQANYLTTYLWYKPRKPEWSDFEWQLRDWLYFYWLSGDHVVEQHIHSLDKALWIMQDVPPKKVTASGGRACRTQEQFGNVYDHFNSIFEWADGTKCFSGCRQWSGKEQISLEVSDWVYGTDGSANVQQQHIYGKNPFRKPDSHINMYDAEHRALFGAIRSGNTINNGDYMCKSTLMGIMARQSAYTGTTVTWDQVLTSKEDLRPAKYEFGPLPTPPIPVPGTVKWI
jgi:myo-inositol 2-dehydrogenase/D-chiro-inositol 1-dehydrogenase